MISSSPFSANPTYNREQAVLLPSLPADEPTVYSCREKGSAHRFASASTSALSAECPRYYNPRLQAGGSTSRLFSGGDGTGHHAGRRNRGRRPACSRNAILHSAETALWLGDRSSGTETTSVGPH